MTILSRQVAVWVMLLSLVQGGCSSLTELPPTPNILRDGSGSASLAKVDSSLQKPDMEILYVTDRSETGKSPLGPLYGYGRATSLAFGTATMSLKPAPSWDDLVKLAGQGQKDPELKLDLTKIHEEGQVAINALSLEVRDQRLEKTAEAMQELEASKQKFRDLIKSHLAMTPDKDVYLYVHGFNNSFYDAIARASILWHYIGRKGVFITYTWPAGKGGAFGYFYDRESGEFTILHLREMIRVVAEMPEVQRLHIIAHSRGTDVATTALRELNIDYRAQGKDVHQALKLETLMLAAPDLDVDVFGQRFWLENLGAVANRTVIYFSDEDKAIALSDWLFSSRTRIGTIGRLKFAPQQIALIQQITKLQMVQCDVSGFSSSHAYVFGNPAAMSDVVAVLRDHRDAGAENGRPLKRLDNGFWLLTNDYFAGAGNASASAAK